MLISKRVSLVSLPVLKAGPQPNTSWQSDLTSETVPFVFVPYVTRRSQLAILTVRPGTIATAATVLAGGSLELNRSPVDKELLVKPGRIAL